MISHSLCSLKVGSTTQHSQQNVPGASSWPKSPVANLQPRTKHLSGKGRKCWQSQPTSGAGSLGGGGGGGEVIPCKPHDWAPGGSNDSPKEIWGHTPHRRGTGCGTANSSSPQLQPNQSLQEWGLKQQFNKFHKGFLLFSKSFIQA